MTETQIKKQRKQELSNSHWRSHCLSKDNKNLGCEINYLSGVGYTRYLSSYTYPRRMRNNGSQKCSSFHLWSVAFDYFYASNFLLRDEGVAQIWLTRESSACFVAKYQDHRYPSMLCIKRAECSRPFAKRCARFYGENIYLADSKIGRCSITIMENLTISPTLIKPRRKTTLLRI